MNKIYSEMKLVLKNATIVNENKTFLGYIIINNEKIEEVNEGTPPDIHEAIEYDLTGKIIFPGIIDTHVHFREPGLTHKADFFTESRAAAAGGITSIFDMPNVLPQTTTIEAWKEKKQIAEKKSLVNFALYLGATNTNLEELTNADYSLIPAIKVFMGSSTGNMLVDNEEVLKKIFSTGKKVVVHSENENIIQSNLQKAKKEYGENIPIYMHSYIRNKEACITSTKKAIDIALKNNTSLHFLHISTPEEIELISNAKKHNHNITTEVVINHLFFDTTDYKHLGTLVKFNPAVKSPEDKQELLNALSSNKIDTIATDHAPHTLKEKQNTYLKAPSGVPMIQHSLQAVMELYKKGILSLEQIAEKMAHNPARIFKIKNRGFIKKGYFADLTIIDPKEKMTVTKENILYKCGWSPFENFTFHSKVYMTIINGNIVYHNGNFDLNYRGKNIEFEQ
jgi:dihydroorotase